MGINETRNKIVNVADRLFGRFGFQKTSMDEIAKIARKAKGSLYYHFSSKEDLFREVVQKEVDEIKSRLSIVVHDSSMQLIIMKPFVPGKLIISSLWMTSGMIFMHGKRRS